MTSYVALLRGVNVGGRNKVAMAGLRSLAEQLGYGAVRTHITSGNLLFEAPAAEPDAGPRHAAAIGAALAQELGVSVDVAVRTATELAAAVAANPFPDGDPGQVHLTFLMGPAARDAESRIAALATAQERSVLADREIYVDYAGGLARSRLAVGLARAVGVSGTSRNLRTCRALVDLFGAEA